MHEIKDIITVEIINIKHFGFFFKTNDGFNGLVHISEISNKYVYDINDFFKKSQKVEIEILEIDKNKKQILGSFKKANSDIDFQNVEFYDTKNEFDILEEKIPLLIKKRIKEIKMKREKNDD